MTFLIQQTLIYAVPLMIVALAGVFAERSGIINLALEGIMIFGAFIGVLFVRLMQGSAAVFLLCYLLVMLSMFSIGMMVGGLAPDTKTASIAACALFFPMPLFCPGPPCLTRSCPPYCSGSLIFCLLHRELSC